MNRYRALSIHQPWAWSIAAGHKKIENRTWTTKYRGPVAIHASINRERLKSLQEKLGDKFDASMFPCGVVVGVADLVDVQPMSQGLEGDPDAVGDYCWQFERPKQLQTPVKAKGKTSLFYLSEEESAQVEAALSDGQSDTPNDVTQIVEAARLNPWGLAFYRAETYWKAEQDEDVLRCCEQAIDLDPTATGPWQYKAMSLHVQKRFAEAMKCIERALQLDDSNGSLYLVRSEIWEGLGDEAKSKADYHRAVELDPRIAETTAKQAGSDGVSCEGA